MLECEGNYERSDVKQQHVLIGVGVVIALFIAAWLTNTTPYEVGLALGTGVAYLLAAIPLIAVLTLIGVFVYKWVD